MSTTAWTKNKEDPENDYLHILSATTRLDYKSNPRENRGPYPQNLREAWFSVLWQMLSGRGAWHGGKGISVCLGDLEPSTKGKFLGGLIQMCLRLHTVEDDISQYLQWLGVHRPQTLGRIEWNASHPVHKFRLWQPMIVMPREAGATSTIVADKTSGIDTMHNVPVLYTDANALGDAKDERIILAYANTGTQFVAAMDAIPCMDYLAFMKETVEMLRIGNIRFSDFIQDDRLSTHAVLNVYFQAFAEAYLRHKTVQSTDEQQNERGPADEKEKMGEKATDEEKKNTAHGETGSADEHSDDASSGSKRKNRNDELSENDEKAPATISVAQLAEETSHTRDVVAMVASMYVFVSDEQRLAIHEICEKHKTAFISGGAGVGKSHVMRIIKAKLELSSRKFAVTASTGKASVGIGGGTFHRFMGIGLGQEGLRDCVSRIYFRGSNPAKNATLSRILNTEVLIIDEISMLDPTYFRKCDTILRHVRKRRNQLFGGIQLILCGDYYQLPPVRDLKKAATKPMAHRGGTRSNTNNNNNNNYNNNNTNNRSADVAAVLEGIDEKADNASAADYTYCFEVPEWKSGVEFQIEFTKVYRQQGDTTFINILGNVREGRLTASDRTILESRLLSKLSRAEQERPEVRDATQIYPRLDEVYNINCRRLREIDEKIHTFSWNLIYNPEKRISEAQKSTISNYFMNNLPVDKDQTYKVGARVLLIVNLDGDNGLVNGLGGYITQIKKPALDELAQGKVHRLDMAIPYVKFDGRSDEIAIEPYSFTYNDVDVPVSSSKDKAAQNVLDGINDDADEDMETKKPKKGQPDWLAMACQIPLQLGWAFSIHKSQGMSIKNVVVGASRIFDYGQMYVALSRAESLQGLYLDRFDASKIQVDPKVTAFYAEMRAKNKAQYQQVMAAVAAGTTPTVGSTVSSVGAQSQSSESSLMPVYYQKCTPVVSTTPPRAAICEQTEEEKEEDRILNDIERVVTLSIPQPSSKRMKSSSSATSSTYTSWKEVGEMMKRSTETVDRASPGTSSGTSLLRSSYGDVSHNTSTGGTYSGTGLTRISYGDMNHTDSGNSILRISYGDMSKPQNPLHTRSTSPPPVSDLFKQFSFTGIME